MPKLPAYLSKNRHGTYYFRHRIPALLKHHLSRSEIRFSLKTNSLKFAVKLARIHKLNFDTVMTDFEEGKITKDKLNQSISELKNLNK